MFDKLSSKFLFLCVIIATSFGIVFAQNTATLRGSVADANGAVIVGSTVRALNLGSNRETVVTTSGDGRFEFINLRPGSYRISAVNQGFATSAKNIIVRDGENIEQNFSLSPGAIEDVVTVTAGKGSARVAVDVPQAISVITEKDIEQQRPRSTFEAIERAPNVIVRETNPARQRPRLRGLDSSRVLIVIDGERLNNARTDLNTGLSPSIIDVTQLESVEVVGGAGSSLYGSDSLAGTINLITKGPNRPNEGVLLGVRFDGNYASNGKVRRGDAVINLSNKMAAFRASGSLFRLDNYSVGKTGISQDEVLSIGRFYTSIPSGVPNAAGVFDTNQANGFPIFAVPGGVKVLNGQGHGGNGQFDLWFYPSEKNNFRGRYITSQHSNLGDAFSGPPYETQERFNPFRNYDKLGLRYEGLDFGRYLPRITVNFYRQKLTFPQAQYDYINQAATAANPTSGSYIGNTFTGSPSRFTLNGFTNNQNTVTTTNIDTQATLAPFRGLFVTVGAQNLEDSSQDEFANYPFANGDRTVPILGSGQRGASSPNSTYRDRAAFFQAEFDRISWLRLSGGLRVDNWSTKAVPTTGFPLGLEFSILQNALPRLQANPGSLAGQIDALPELINLANGTGEAETDRTTLTGSFGVVFRLPFGINPYARYGTSYREPSITERYLIRNFTAFRGFYPLVVGNPALEPETGRTFDVGIKTQRKNYNASFGYFRNDLKNLIIFQSPDFASIFCVAPTGGLPGLPFPFAGCRPGQAAINFNGRINQANNVISGFEGTGEYSVALGRFGSLNPFVSFGTLKGTNESPTPLQLFIIDQIYNRNDTTLELTGSKDDVPLDNITPFRIIGGAQYSDAAGRFFAEYSFRHQKQVTRANPTRFVGSSLINFGTFASLDGFTKHNFKVGYAWRTDRYRFSLNGGVDNFTDKFYFEQFQNAPAPGRSFIFGFTTEIFNLLKK